MNVHASRTAGEWLAAQRWPFAAAVGAGLFLAASGAFGTGAIEPVWLRFAYWLPLLAGGELLGTGVAWLVIDRWRWAAASRWGQGAALTLLLTLVLAPLVWAWTAALFTGGWRLAELLGFAGPVLAVTAGMVALNYLLNRQPAVTHAAPAGAGEPAPATAPVRFLERLPAKLRGAELWAVEAEDHYLRLHTSRGSDLILLRLTDALAELDGVEGAQTHRGWWVARAAVAATRRADGRAALVLPDGTAAPVSRTYARALREAGWF